MRSVALMMGVCMALLVLGGADAAADGKSTFRLMQAQRCQGGCYIQLSYQNKWPNAQQQDLNSVVTFTGYIGQRAFPLGTQSMGFEGTLTLQLNYANAGVRAGELLTVDGRWSGGHRWGTGGKSAGSLTLP